MSQTEGATPIRAVPPDDAPMSCLTMSPRAAFAGVAVSALVAIAAGMYVSAVVADPERSAAGAAPMVMVFLVALGTLSVAFLNLRWLLRNGVTFTTPIAPNEPERSTPVAEPQARRTAEPVAAAEPAPARLAAPTRAAASPTFTPVRRNAPVPAADAPAAVPAGPAAAPMPEVPPRAPAAPLRPTIAPAPAFEDPAPTNPAFVAPAAGPATLTPAPVATPQPAPAATPTSTPDVGAPQGEPLPSLPVVDARPAPAPAVVVPTRAVAEHPTPAPAPAPEPEPEPEPEFEADPAFEPDAAPAAPRRVLRPQRVGRGTDRTGPKGAKAAEGKAAPKRVAGRPRT